MQTPARRQDERHWRSGRWDWAPAGRVTTVLLTLSGLARPVAIASGAGVGSDLPSISHTKSTYLTRGPVNSSPRLADLNSCEMQPKAQMAFFLTTLKEGPGFEAS